MLPRDQRPPAFPADLFEGPAGSYSRTELVSDADVTRPHNPTPDMDAPPNSRQWHVQLELRPEQLVALHRMGFTGGALAWREGMDGWQPLRVGETVVESRSDDSLAEADDDEETSTAEERPGSTRPPAPSSRRFSFPRGPTSSAPVGLVQATPVSRPPASSDQVLDDLLGAPLPPPPRLPTSLPPPPRQPDDVLYEPPLRVQPERGLAVIPKPAWLTQSPVTLERTSYSFPPATLDSTRARGVTLKTLAAGFAATVLLSASVGALVASAVWSLQMPDSEPQVFAEKSSESTTAQPPSAPKATAELTPPRPAAVSVDELPLLSGSRTAAPVTITDASQGASAPPRSAPQLAAEHPSIGAARRAAAEAPQPRRAPSLEDKIANSASSDAPDSRKPDAEETPVPPVQPGPADRDAIARAVAQAAAAARSCGSGPENGTVMVKFSPSGAAQSIQLVKPFSNRDVNGCVLRAMSRARVSAFVGEAVSVRKTLRW